LGQLYVVIDDFSKALSSDQQARAGYTFLRETRLAAILKGLIEALEKPISKAKAEASASTTDAGL
jgi:D-mannonate dehydratase